MLIFENTTCFYKEKNEFFLLETHLLVLNQASFKPVMHFQVTFQLAHATRRKKTGRALDNTTEAIIHSCPKNPT